jgi:hypothetical protein
MQNLTRNINIGFRVNEKERELIRRKQEQSGIQNLRSYLLKMAVDGQVIHLEVSGVSEMIRLLSNATNNINQIAKRVNETGNFYAADLDDLRRRYDEIWTQVKVILRKLATL